MRWARKVGITLVGAGIVAALLIVGVYTYSYLVLRKAFVFTKSDAHNVITGIDSMQRLINTDSRREWWKVDYSSVGAPDRELQLMNFRSALGYYELRNVVSPISVAELNSLASTHDLPDSARQLYRTLASSCQMYASVDRSFLLSCDGLTAEEAARSGDKLRMEPRVERFYKLGAHVILRVPWLSTTVEQ